MLELSPFDSDHDVIMKPKGAVFFCIFVCFAWAGALAGEGVYDPLAVRDASVVQIFEDTLIDQARAREVPIRVYLPSEQGPAPVVLFSHGLGGSCQNNPYLGNHWASRGYVAVFIQHLGSDESVWKRARLGQAMAAMKGAANVKNAILRFEDVRFVLDQLELVNADADAPLFQRMDLDKVGMSGHSFGAVTTQGVSGQVFSGREVYTDARIDAALAMSPSSPNFGSTHAAFGEVTIPWLLMTGTEDRSPIRETTVASRLAVYPALPAGDKYELLLSGAQHSAFGENTRRQAARARNPNHHPAILAISTAFWDAYLKDDSRAKEWLQSEARTVLEADDRWQWK